jgi:hypothetical protein
VGRGRFQACAVGFKAFRGEPSWLRLPLLAGFPDREPRLAQKTMASEDEEVYEVEKLVDQKPVKGKSWKTEYFVKWRNYPSSDNTWEPRQNLGASAAALIKDLAARKVAEDSTPKKKQKKNNSNKRAAEAAPLKPKKPKKLKQPAPAPAPAAVPEAAAATAADHDDAAPAATAASAAAGVDDDDDAAPAAAAEADSEGKSEYELARERTIARNHEMLRALGLLETKEEIRRSQQASSPTNRRQPRQKAAHDGPRRKSARQPGSGDAAAGQDAEEQDDDESWRPVYKPRTFFYNDGRDYGANTPISEWKMPIVRDAQGNEMRRRLSCHVCTQCVASWRGAFSLPLGCATCPLIWCSRCLSNIFNFDGDEANGLDIGEVIKRANTAGTWSCFKCTDRCACQSTDSNMRGLTTIERHKKWGWVGVTGNRDASCVKPKHVAIADAGVAAVGASKGK